MKTSRILRQCVLLTLLCCGLPGQGYASPVELTLPDSIRLALTSSHEVKIAKLEATKADLEFKKTKTGYLPTVSMTHTQTQVAEKPKPEYGNYITVKLPLYDGGRTQDRVTQSRTAAAGLTDSLSHTKQQVAANVILNYYDALAAKERAELAGQAVRQLTSHLDEVRHQAAAGDFPQTEAKLTRLREYHMLLQQEQQQVLGKLSHLLHLPRDQELTLAAIPEQPVPVSLDQAIDHALAHRQDLAQVRRDLQTARLGIKIAAKESLPTIYLYCVVNDLGLPEQYWYSSLYVTGNLFDGGQTKLKTRQSDLHAAIAEERVQQKIETITGETITAFERWQQSGQNLSAALQPVTTAEKNYVSAIAGHQAGNSRIDSVLEAYTVLTTARIDYLNTRYNHYKCQVHLLRTIGTLPAF